MFPHDMGYVFWENEDDALFKVLFPRVLKAGLAGAEASVDSLGQFGVGVDWGLVNDAVRDWARSYTFNLVKGINGTTRSFLQKSIPEWIESGSPLPDLIESLKPMFGQVRAEMIAVTEVTNAFAQGNILTWKESGVVEGIRWQTAEDELVCPICGELDGKEGTLDGGVNGTTPPAHVRCRCWLFPVVGA